MTKTNNGICVECWPLSSDSEINVILLKEKFKYTNLNLINKLFLK